MNDLYKEGEMCLNFSNEEIQKELVEPIKKIDGIKVKIKSPDDILIDLNENDSSNIGFIILDDEEDFFISFDSYQISIYFLGEEIMLIDDSAKSSYSFSDTEYNIVYEGAIRECSHHEILSTIYEMIKLLSGAQEVSIRLTPSELNGRMYKTYKYELDIISNNNLKGVYKFENIVFLVK